MPKYSLTVWMGKRDVTKWVQSCEVEQPPDCIYRQAKIDFAGWSAIESGARWDVCGSYNPAKPRAELLLRAGAIPPDRERRVIIAAGKVPTFSITVYDYVWHAQRRTSDETIVMVPDAGGLSADVALENWRRKTSAPVGVHRVWSHVRTVGDAVKRLAARGGFRVIWGLPAYDMAPRVVDPKMSYWKAMLDLANPYAPEVYYRPTSNQIVFLDPYAVRYGVGSQLELDAKAVYSIPDVGPVTRNRVRRVILSVPPCR
ncbi:MAG: hypothetical protein GY906_11665 [bacterium]|nr:hypothetical protein [bacterium]